MLALDSRNQGDLLITGVQDVGAAIDASSWLVCWPTEPAAPFVTSLELFVAAKESVVSITRRLMLALT